MNKGDFKYKMTRTLANELVKEAKGDEKNMELQPYLCAIVNNQFRAKGNCIEVIFS